METPNFQEELELVRRAQEGERQALSELVRRYSSRIYHLGLRLTGNRQDAEDIVQDTFMIMVKKIKQFEGKSSFYTWLYRVAMNVGLRRLKSRHLYQEQVAIDNPDFERLAIEGTHDWPQLDFSIVKDPQFRQRLNQMIAELPPIYRTVFILRDLHELSTEDTSKILQITPSNVKIRLMRARAFLKERLEHLLLNA